jgi:hypothetical protein
VSDVNKTVYIGGYRHPFVMALIEAGIISINSRRSVIDITANGVVTVYEEVFANGEKISDESGQPLSRIRAGVEILVKENTETK